jgi:hypothetical protein
MTIGAVVLMALDRGSLKGGAFSLSLFIDLPGEEVVMQSIDKDVRVAEWSRVEVFYSDTCSGNVAELSVLKRLTDNEGLGAHFVICNGVGGKEGEIQPTQQWVGQEPAVAGHESTIRICLVGNGVENGLKVGPSETQINRANNLASFFCRQFKISSRTAGNVQYPANWQF